MEKMYLEFGRWYSGDNHFFRSRFFFSRSCLVTSNLMREILPGTREKKEITGAGWKHNTEK